jgi:hypothetical protein
MGVMELLASARATCSTDGAQLCDTGLPVVAANSSTLATVLTIVFGILGALSLLMIVIGGFRMVEAQGNPDGIKRGRNTVIYALVGLILAISAQVIVAFVLGSL